MKIEAVKTPKVRANDCLKQILDNISVLRERSVVAVTSKIVSLCEGKIVKKEEIDKRQLIKKEADVVLDTGESPYDMCLTIKNGILIPSAGIDESNADNSYVLYPSDLWKSAEQIWIYLRTKHNLKEFGVIITDSHTTMMRRGVTGIALSWCGFSPLYSYIGKDDLFGYTLQVTQINTADALAVSAVFCMGEGSEQTPMAVITNIPRIFFLDRKPTNEEKNSVFIGKDEDLYAPLLKGLSIQ